MSGLLKSFSEIELKFTGETWRLPVFLMGY